MDNYVQFANIYDKLMDDFDYSNWAEYIVEILNRNNIETNKILELACGTGNMTIELLKRGYKVDAFDLSNDMLTQAQQKLSKFKNLRLFHMDMTNFNINTSYDVAISICDSINYILDKEDLIKTFSNVYNHLNSGGVFIFDINSKYKIQTVLGNNTFIEDRESVFYTWDNRYNLITNIGEYYLTFFTSTDGIIYKRFDEMHKQRAYSVEEIHSMLESVGFKHIEFTNAFEFEEITEKTERVNFVAIK
ncbi:MAG: methyltransferase domain-containing protein [Gudongella sp.]|nr:methyltransferase domain-containing protein [Gudongella sp.]